MTAVRQTATDARGNLRWVRIGATMRTASSQVRTVVGCCPGSRCLVPMNCPAISANTMNAAMPSISRGSM